MGLMGEIPQRLTPSSRFKYWCNLYIVGASLDIGVIQIRRSIWKHFNCYPKLGLALNYGHLENKGSLLKGLLYLEPQYDYLARWEIVPRIGVGIAYVNIPGTNFKKLKPEEAEAIQNNDVFAEDIYRQGLHLDLSTALVVNIRLTPHWQLSPSISFSYMPAILSQAPNEGKRKLEVDKNLKIFMTNIGIGYTPNPSLIRYPDVGNSKKVNVDVSLLSTFKKIRPTSQQVSLPSKAKQQEDKNNSGKYYYVGGIYGQWSLQLSRNHAFTLATEWIHDGAAKQALKEKIRSSAWKSSLLGGHEFRWGKFVFGQQIGFYLTNNDEEFGVYTRLGLSYKLLDSWFVGTSLKTIAILQNGDFYLNSLQQDFIDFRIGYSF